MSACASGKGGVEPSEIRLLGLAWICGPEERQHMIPQMSLIIRGVIRVQITAESCSSATIPGAIRGNVRLVAIAL